MLGAEAIRNCIHDGTISITDFDEKRLNPNSYNLRLAPKLLVYTDPVLDMKKYNSTQEIIIPKEGLTLVPGEFYLGSTIEETYTPYHVPGLDGRSSIARLGICVHITAGFGDVGFKGRWTLEITVAKPVKIYPEVEIAQVYFNEIYGEIKDRYHGKYQNATDVMASRMFKDV